MPWCIPSTGGMLAFQWENAGGLWGPECAQPQRGRQKGCSALLETKSMAAPKRYYSCDRRGNRQVYRRGECLKHWPRLSLGRTRKRELHVLRTLCLSGSRQYTGFGIGNLGSQPGLTEYKLDYLRRSHTFLSRPSHRHSHPHLLSPQCSTVICIHFYVLIGL